VYRFPSAPKLVPLAFFASIFNTTVEENYNLVKDIYAHIEPFKKRKAGKLSGGMKQKLALSCALIHRPAVLFLDEPTTGLDPQARRNLWDLIKEIRSKGTTVIITTHYMDEAEILCDRVAIIDSGNIIAEASPDKLIDELVASGFEKPKEVKQANLEDVFIHLTGHDLRAES